MSYVVVVSSELNHSVLPGLSIFQRDLIEAASKSGIVCELLAPANVFILRVKRSNIITLLSRLSPVPSNSLFSLPGFLFRGLIRYRKIVNRRAGEPSIIHAHNTLHAGILALVISKAYGIPFIVTEHNRKIFSGWLQIKLIRLVYKYASRITTVSASTKDTICDSTQARDVQVVPNVISVGFFEPFVSRARSNEVLVVGNFDRNKDQMFALEVAKELEGLLGQQFSVKFIGDGALLSQCINYASFLGLETVEFQGYCNRDVVRERMLQARILLNVSRSETFGVVNVEAGLCGCAVISNDNGGARDSTVTGVSAIFTDKDVKSVAILIRQWLDKDLDHEEIAALYRKMFMSEMIVRDYYGDYLPVSDLVSP